jgi:fumarylacetoacetate (FAA) hydrolase family protein
MEMQEYLTPAATLPADGTAGTLVGRVWMPGDPPGPAVVAIREDGVYDISHAAPTMADLANAEDPLALAQADGERLGDLAAVLENSAYDRRDPMQPYVLAPCDLQALKACGVTFATSLLERVIEEQARGDASKSDAIRARIADVIGTDLSKVKPGSDAATRLKQHLVQQGAWSQYLEVGIGPYAEVFTKAPPMAAVGTGSEIGIHPESTWNNPEPEVVLVVNARGEIVGASLGNDVNLRDFEGRSALLLGKAKDNNASCAIGPFIRLLDRSFDLERLRRTTVSLKVAGSDGFELAGSSSMAEISRDVTDLVGQTIGPNHQYPDGFMLFAGTMFAPIQDRDQPGQGFTHKRGDLVTISCPELGALVNRVEHCHRIAPWIFGTGALMRNLAARRLL